MKQITHSQTNEAMNLWEVSPNCWVYQIDGDTVWHLNRDAAISALGGK